MSIARVFDACYSASWAFIVGVDRYQHCPPLQYAVNDARDFASILQSRFGFKEQNIISLYDDQATQDQIRRRYFDLAGELTENDRLVFFFAGHGHNVRTIYGDTGFLVPVDGDLDSMSTLISWNEMLNRAKTFHAKHVFWILDSCFSGTAFRRKIPRGSRRFVNDMLERSAWQLITSGKHDEPVADGDGPRQGHSLFTGHLLDALDGKACDTNGSLTANRIMSYVYDKVATSYSSEQTPHFGMIDGEGDMIFLPLQPISPNEPSEVPQEHFVESSPAGQSWQAEPDKDSLEIRMKTLLARPGSRILIDDLVTSELRAFMSRVQSIEINHSRLNNSDRIVQLLNEIETASVDLFKVIALLCHWGSSEHDGIIRKVVLRIADALGITTTSALPDALRWYSGILVAYCGTIGSVSSENYERMGPLLLTRVASSSAAPISFSEYVGFEQLNLVRADVFKKIKGHEQNYFPLNEYIFSRLQPLLEDLFFLGSSYEDWFDWCEIIRAILDVEARTARGHDVWGTPGRFVYRHLQRRTNLYTDIRNQALKWDRDWPLARAGFFGRSGARFADLADKYEAEMPKYGRF